MNHFTSLLLSVFGTAILTAEPVKVFDTVEATHSESGVHIVTGKLELPRKGDWFVVHPFAHHGGLTEIYLSQHEEADEEEFEGERMARIQDRRDTRERQYALRRVYWKISSFARKGDGVAPGSIEDYNNLAKDDEDLDELNAEGIHYIGGLRLFRKEGERMVTVDKAEPLLIDTNPAIDDGKHWVIDSQGASERVEIDQELVKKLGLTIKAKALPSTLRTKDKPKTEEYNIFARIIGEPGPTTLTAREFSSKETLTIEWNPSMAVKGDDEVCKEWAGHRLDYFHFSVRRDAPIGHYWAQRTIAQYHLEEDYGYLLPQDERFGGRTSNAMGVLGGRAAIQETLQLRNLAAEAEDEWKPSIPVGEIPGVEVESHPFEKMLDGKEGGQLPLAEWIPQDHFLAYFPEPKSILSMLEGGSDFIFSAGSTATGRHVAYHLKERYLADIGMSEKLLRNFLKTGAIEEMAVTVPDLFFIDGTEVSAVMRLGKPLLSNAALALVGVPPGDGLTVKKNDHGEEVHWMRRGPILVVSTSGAEVKAITAAKDEGRNLAASAELRYMLTQVPLTGDTRAFLYFSDPFIRKLVGPKTKIGQLRRLFAKTELEEASAGSLLARFEGHGESALKLPFLRENGFVRQSLYAADLELDGSAVSSSGSYGQASRMKSLTDLPLELVSEQERKAYEQYLENYNRFWRRYYDPIAIRYEKSADGTHRMETFILPLIENSIYGGLRQFLALPETQGPLRVPVIEPQPVAMMSVNLNEEALIEVMDDLSASFEAVLGLDGALLDLIASDVHLAIQDADPIIGMGSGELGSLFGQMGSDSGEMFWLSSMISLFTRPCTIHIGLQDPDEVRKLLTGMSWNPGDWEDDFSGFGSGSLAKVTGEERWIYRWSVENMITMRFGVEVQDRYLIINNLPFTNKVKVTGNQLAPNGSASLELAPEACKLQLPALFASAVEQNRTNATAGAACLMPLVLDGKTDLATAQKRHKELFGFEPLHPGGGTWTWDAAEGELVSSLYGPQWAQRQPPYDPDNEAVGLMRRISRLNLRMQFEDDGLRSAVQWRLRD